MALDEHDLSEDLLWGEDGAASGSEAEPSEGSEDPGGSGEPPVDAAAAVGSRGKQKGLDITGASSASHQSSTLRSSLDDLDAAGPTPSPPVDVPGGGFRRAAAANQPLQFEKAQQRQQPYTRLGTSAPIAIPNMAGWRGGAEGKGSGRQADAASTFIPPHQLSRQEDFTFSFTGASPSATLKRERLRARNAILRSTGFLEPRAGQAIPAAAPAPAEQSMARTPVQSSLTAALTTIGET